MKDIFRKYSSNGHFLTNAEYAAHMVEITAITSAVKQLQKIVPNE